MWFKKGGVTSGSRGLPGQPRLFIYNGELGARGNRMASARLRAIDDGHIS